MDRMNENVHNITENVKPKGLGSRHLQILLLFFAMFLAFTMKVNLSMAIVDMTDLEKEGSYDWNTQVKSLILSSFFWGYVVLQIPGGMLARRVGGSVLITIAISVNALISLIIPLLAEYGGWQMVCLGRILQGLTQGVIIPCMHYFISQWVPLEEKGALSTIVYSGGQLGMFLQLMSSGFIAAAWGWPAIFYINAALGLLWTAAYLVFGSDSPEKSKLISKAELHYIQTSLGRIGEQKRYPTPWPKIMTSLPFLAVIIAHCGQNWGFFTLMTEMPTYMSQVLNFDLQSNGVLSSLPYLATLLLNFPMGALTDYIVRKKLLTVTNSRKLFNTIGTWGPAIALIGLSFATAENSALAVVMLVIAVGINAGVYSGFMLVHIDMAPNFSATLVGISNFLASTLSIIAPMVCGFIVKDETDPDDWRIVFFIAAGVYFFNNLFFLIFGTSERQSWNEPEENTETGKKNLNQTNVAGSYCNDYRTPQKDIL